LCTSRYREVNKSKKQKLGRETREGWGRSRGKITVPIFFPEDESCVIGAWCHLFGVDCCNNASDRDTRYQKTTQMLFCRSCYCVECRAYNGSKCMFCDINGHLEFKQEHVDIETNTNIMVSVYKLLS
jgi:hypothetical protein